MSQPIDEQQTRPTTSIKLNTLCEVAIERISDVYSHDMAGKEGIYYWPKPLPAPTATLPDPLILFSPETLHGTPAEIKNLHEYLTVIPMTRREVLERRSHEHMKPSMQIPIGLIDKPERQQRESLLIDLHGTTGDLTGGPLLIVGAQQSGKATALETMLFWLTTRFLPSQLRCAIIDPLTELDRFHTLPHTHASNGDVLWTDGRTDEQLKHFTHHITTDIQGRQSTFPDLRWNTQTLTQLWAQKKTIPQLLLIISNYQLFAERPSAVIILKKFVQTVIEAHAMGMYLVITSTESSSHFIPVEIMSKCTTRIGLSLNDVQHTELFGKTTFVSEPIPGRGLIMTPDQKINQIQLALPLAGKSENLRAEYLRNELSLVLP